MTGTFDPDRYFEQRLRAHERDEEEAERFWDWCESKELDPEEVASWDRWQEHCHTENEEGAELAYEAHCERQEMEMAEWEVW